MVGIKQIAEEAGVSKTTVSFVLNGRHEHGMRVSAPVAERVLATAKRLGYVRNELVQAMVKGRSRVIAVIANFSGFMMPIIQGYSDEAAKHGYSITLIPLENSSLNTAFMKAVSCRVAGIITPGLPRETVLEQLGQDAGKYNIRLSAAILKKNPFDQKGSAEKAVEYLFSLGHRRIACFNEETFITSLRRKGYEDVMKAHGETAVIFRPPQLDAMIDSRPDAVFCGHDGLAAQLMQRMYERNLRVPDTFSIMGFGGTESAAAMAPALSTVNEPYYDLALSTIRWIINFCNGIPVPEYQPRIADLVIGGTTARRISS